MSSTRLRSISGSALRGLIILAVLAYVTATLIFGGVESASQYEASVLGALPFLGLLLLIASLSFATIAVLLAVRWRHYTLAGLAHSCLVLCSLTVTALPLIRGYYSFGRGDLLTHIGFIRDIGIFGHLPTYDYSLTTPFLAGYPGIHMFIASMIETSGFEVGAAAFLVGPLIYGFLLTSVVVASYALRWSTSERLLALVPVHFLPIGVVWIYSLPAAAAISIAPLFVGLTLHSALPSSRLSFMAILLGTMLILTHPLIALGIIALLILVLISRSIARRFLKHRATGQGVYYGVPLALSVFSVLWLSGHSVIWETSVLSVLSTLESQSQLALVAGSVRGTGLRFDEVARVAILSFWPHAVVALFGVGALMVAKSRGPGPPSRSFPVYVSLVAVIAFLALATLVLGFAGFGAWRFAVLAVVLLIPLSGHYVSRVMRTVRSAPSRRYLTGSVAVLLLTGMIIGPIAYFPSPTTIRPNDHIPEAEVLGYAYLAHTASPLHVNHIHNSRFWTTEYAESGYLNAQQTGIATVLFVPRGLAYGDKCPPQSAIKVPVSAFTIHYYTELYPDSDVVSAEQMQLFLAEPCAHRVYDNGGFLVNIP